ncbi:MAG: hypothetical protein IJB96_01885 [Lachnospira sp.]|nr:hypothetical protein [Lachnospira sp.]
MDYYSNDPLLNNEMLISIIVVIIGFFLLVAFFVNIYLPFKEERDCIKMEIARSFDEEEYLYWKRELRRLYLSYIPLVGRFFR